MFDGGIEPAGWDMHWGGYDQGGDQEQALHLEELTGSWTLVADVSYVSTASGHAPVTDVEDLEHS